MVQEATMLWQLHQVIYRKNTPLILRVLENCNFTIGNCLRLLNMIITRDETNEDNEQVAHKSTENIRILFYARFLILHYANNAIFFREYA